MAINLKKIAKSHSSLIILTFFFMVSSILNPMQAISVFAAEDGKPQTNAVSAMLFDAHRGQVIISNTSDETSHSPLASHILTVLIALEKADIESAVTVSKDAAGVKGATLNLTVGEKYTLRNLVNALLLTGSPDAAVAIAEYVGGSQNGFVKMMNEYAINLGMKNTNFKNCTGAFDENQFTNIEDIAILIKYALANANFNYFFGTQARPWYDKTKTLLLTNTNNMFWSYPGTDGGMTASYDKDVQSIITTATKNNMRLVCILLDVPTKNMYTDSINLLNYGFDNYLCGTLVTAGSVLKVVTVENQSLNLVPATDVHYIYPKGEDFIKGIEINIDESKLRPPLTKNTIVGMMTYTLLDDTVISVELYPDREILPQKTTKQILKERVENNKELIYIIIILIIIEFFMGIYKLSARIKRQVIKSQARKSRRRSRY
jgi:D-alanyl-D-alanine carboxypeptidase (penicillin-binding protein 5/6)